MNCQPTVTEKKSALLRRIEEANFNAFPSEMTHMDGSWFSRLAPGNPARRVNSLNVLEPSDDRDLKARLACCQALFRHHGVPFHFRWTPLAPQALASLCDEMGWQGLGHTDVWIKPIEGPVERWKELPDAVTFQAEPLKAWLAAFVAIGGTRPEAVTPEAARKLESSLARIVQPPIFIVARNSSGAPVGTALATLHTDLLGIYDVAVAPGERRRGLGERLVSRCLAFGAEQGCRTAWLQVIVENIAARALYRNLGFTDLYSYFYRRPAP